MISFDVIQKILFIVLAIFFILAAISLWIKEIIALFNGSYQRSQNKNGLISFASRMAWGFWSLLMAIMIYANYIMGK
jgi:hypothetical protein